MNRIFIGNKNIVTLMLLLIFSVGILAQDTPGTTETLNTQLQEIYRKKIAYKKDVYARTLRFINENPTSPGLATLYFHLAEMSTEIDVDDPSITVGYYNKVLEKDPNFLEKDAVLYNIGYYGFAADVYERDESRQNNIDMVMNWPDSLRLSEERLQYVIDAYQEILEKFSESNYYTEAAYRLGTVYFEIALDARIPKPYYDKAIYYFNEVAKRENDPLEYHGLFQRGWTYFTSANFEKAIEDFSDILEVILIDTLKIMKIYFEADAIENMAFSLIEYDGTDFEQASIAATKAKEIFLNFVNEDYGKEVIQKSIKLKHKYNAPMQAVDLYNAYIWLYPTALECPTFIDSVMTIFKRNPSRTREGVPAEELVIDEYKKLITDYRVDSLWFQTNAEKDLTNQLRVIREAYEFMEPKYYNIFVQSKLENDYLIYKELVENYCQYDAFKDEVSIKKMESMHKGLVDLSQDLAEISQDPRFYFATIDNISTFMESYPDHPALVEYKETEFYNYEKIYNILKPIIKEQVYIDTINNITLDRDALDSLFVQATLSYEDLLSQRIESGKVKESELVRIVYQRAELEYDREEYEAAFEDFKRLLNYNPDNEIKKVAYSRLAEISQDRSDYTQAEGYYREATKYAADEEKQAFNNNILATMQAKANTLSDSADYVTAAQEYLRLSRELEKDDEEQSIQFIVKAIKSYESAGEYQTAIDLYLDIASRKEDKNDILTAYIKAWTISDSLLDWQQSESLRKQFINKFKDSNEAYKLRLQIIAYYEGEQFNDKEKAAEMYLELHNDADNIDIGEDNKESIFLNAFRIYQELDNENKIVDLSLEFEKLYPNHSKANDFLIIVAKIYKDRSEEEKFEELAAYLYKKDPTIDLLVTVAAAKLKEIKTEVDSLFDSKQYDLMYDQIAKFKKAEEHYQAEGLQLPTEAIYEAFDYYDNYLAYHDQYLDRLRKGEMDFLDKSPDELIKVNELTEWKRHLVEGKKRIAKVMEKCDEIKAEIIALIQEGNKYALKTEDRTRALYTAGKVYDYGAYVVKQQIQKYVDISNQLNNEQMQANPVQQTQFKTAILAEANKHRVSFLKKSVQLYNLMLATFCEDKDYSDEWTDLAYHRLVDLGVKKEKIFENIYTNYAWMINKSQIEDITSPKVSIALWTNVNIIPETVVFDSALVVNIPPGMCAFLKKDCEAEIKPELINIEYVYDKPVQIYINDMLIEKDPTLGEKLVKMNNILTPHYTVSTSKNLKSGVNIIVFKIEPDSVAVDATNFASHFAIQYDKEKREFVRTTEKRVLFSDYTWYTKKEGYVIPEEEIDTAEQVVMADSAIVADSLMYAQAQKDTIPVSTLGPEWKLALDAHFEFFKSQMFGLENSEAYSIWFPEIDSTNVETVYFRKDIDIDSDVVEATVKIIAQNTVSLWINDEPLVENLGLIMDDRLKKVQTHEIVITQLKPGMNTILAKVVGGREHKGFIFEMNYIVRKNYVDSND